MDLSPSLNEVDFLDKLNFETQPQSMLDKEKKGTVNVDDDHEVSVRLCVTTN